MMRLTTTLLALACLAPPAAQADDEWSVDNPPGPKGEVSIDVTEGTWMNIDVSPDGRQLVFDLLGDLYLLPIEGGTATALTESMAWDMQPTFSPDGRSLAFTSDRGGGDNLWTLDLARKIATPVTTESYRLLNSPAWSPDGRFVIGRKHYTARRSLGAGALWLYDRRGGSGLELVEKPNDQQDLGEPAFSPDGAFIYYSQDVTPGPRFEYNKDPNAGIYAIRRLELTTGRIETVTGGPGGAVRPTPSPDGAQLAFVRRARGRTVLMVRHLVSGRERVLFDGLDRDMQETWAIHGVSPRLAWTPDSLELVFWAQGGLWRIAAAGGEPRPIPFRVVGRRETRKAIRVPVDVAPPTVRVKTVRTMSVPPAEDRVVYEALGHLYYKGVPDGRPRRLTQQTEHFELQPSWSRDGKQLVYATWHDDRQGSLVLRESSGRERVITQAPGKYLEPRFSPDGASIVYRKAQSGHLLNPAWSGEPGIYLQSLAGGAPRRIARRGRGAHFGASNDRLYVIRSGPGGVTRLVSVDVASGERAVVHLESKFATDFRVSPDGSHVLFVERFQGYVTPFLNTAATRKIGPKANDFPVKRVTSNAAFSLQWTAPGRFAWTTGPTLYRGSVTDAFREPPAPGLAGIDLGFDVPRARPNGMVAFTGARIITMEGDTVLDAGTILVKGDRIVGVGPAAGMTIPDQATVFDVAGHTIMPGLVDVHAHGAQAELDITPQQNWKNLGTLAFGVTTIHDPSNDTRAIFTAAELQGIGAIIAPRIFSTGRILYGAAAWFTATVDSLKDAAQHVRRLKAFGAITVKSYNQPRRDQRQMVLEAARSHQMMVVPEGGSLLQHNLTQVVDGHTGIEHAVPVARVYDDIVQLWSGTSVFYTPTLNVAYGGLMGEYYWYQENNIWNHPRLQRFVPRRVLDARARRVQRAPSDEWNHIAVAKQAARLLRAGVNVTLGAHGQREGLGAHWELWSLHQGGMSALETLRCATLNGALYLGMDRDIGSLAPGKLADFVVIDGNPLDNIRDTEKIVTVVQGGFVYDADTLTQRWPQRIMRPRLWFQAPPTSQKATR